MICQFCLSPLLPIILTFLLLCNGEDESKSSSDRPRKLNPATLNQKAVGLILKANQKRYYISSELCPGGVFLTRPVNENCLCYNGIFQVVRECCDSRYTRIHSDNLEWRMDFKCGTSLVFGNGTDYRPIRAILPLSKPHNRLGSIIIARSLVGNNTSKWRKFDIEDVIISNNGRVNMNGKTQFEIVNIKPLGREIRIMFGKHSDMAVCYSGWLADHQKLRVTINKPGETKGCCFNITRATSSGEISAECSIGTIISEVIDVQSPDVDIGRCDQDIHPEAPHTINKREPYTTFQKAHDFIPNDKSFNHIESLDSGDILGDRGPILFKRAAPQHRETSNGTTAAEDNDELHTADGVIFPRKRGISRASWNAQGYAINEFIAILRNDLAVEIREPLTPRFQLLKKSFDIFLNVIPNEVVPHMLLKTAYDVFYFLYEELEPIIYNPPDIFNRTMHYLSKCLKKEEMLKFKTVGCPKQIDELVINANVKAKMENYYKDQPDELRRVFKALKHIEIRKDKRFIPELHDIYVEINWKVADFVHSLCFDYFGKEFNAHTFYETELEALFLYKDVQRRWYKQNEGDLRYVRGIFPVSDLKLSMKQLDKVTAIGHYLSRYNGSYWLRRPSITIPDQYQNVGPAIRNAGAVPNSEARLIFLRNLLDEARIQVSEEERVPEMVSSADRSVMYPFQYPEKLPPGELIWDGIAVCLHAAYSNLKSYFVDSAMWGVQPSLSELGQIYP